MKLPLAFLGAIFLLCVGAGALYAGWEHGPTWKGLYTLTMGITFFASALSIIKLIDEHIYK